MNVFILQIVKSLSSLRVIADFIQIFYSVYARIKQFPFIATLERFESAKLSQLFIIKFPPHLPIITDFSTLVWFITLNDLLEISQPTTNRCKFFNPRTTRCRYFYPSNDSLRIFQCSNDLQWIFQCSNDLQWIFQCSNDLQWIFQTSNDPSQIFQPLNDWRQNFCRTIYYYKIFNFHTYQTDRRIDG